MNFTDLFSVAMSAIKGPKDALIQVVGRWLCDTYLKGIGKSSDLEVDLKKQEIFVKLLLDGEHEAINITASYAFVDDGCIEITQVNTSRAWITTVINERIPSEKKQIVFPASIGSVLRRVQ